MLTDLLERLQLTPAQRVVSIAGSGGKTTLMFLLALCLHQEGERVAVTTTTHIARPEGEALFVCDGGDHRRMAAAMESGKILVAGRPAENGKLSAPSGDTLTFLRTHAGRLLIEADGSRMLPLKVPNATEPVLLPQTGRVLVVGGLSALGRPLAEACHRWELARERFGYPAEALVSEEMFANILLFGYARYQPTVLLNQADTPEQKLAGRRIAARLSGGGIRQVLLTSFTQQEVISC